jgi:hypothetical protein
MRSLSVTNLPKLLSTFPLNKLAVSLSNPANGPSYSLFMNNLLTRHAQVKRMAISGISDYQIAVLLRVKLNTLKLFFPRELELGAVIASIRPPSVKGARQAPIKETNLCNRPHTTRHHHRPRSKRPIQNELTPMLDPLLKLILGLHDRQLEVFSNPAVIASSSPGAGLLHLPNLPFEGKDRRETR